MKEIATKFGLADSISPEKNSLLMYLTSEQLEERFQKEKEAIDIDQENRIFYEKTKEIRSFNDYIALINAFPLTRKGWVEAHGGESGYSAWVAEHDDVLWHIYRNKNGGILVVKPGIDKGHYEGYERLDDKPRN